MKARIPEDLLAQAAASIASQMALEFPRDRFDDLEHKLASAAREFGFNDAEVFIRWLATAPISREQTDVLASHLTITETYFWREPKVFDALECHILPHIIEERAKTEKRLRIWSAGCATGEEPYSLAIALRRTVPDIDDWNVTIMATDINVKSLQNGIRGVYGKWSFRNTPEWFKEYFVRREDGRFEILPEVRKMVAFAYLNLAEDRYPSAMNNTNAMDLVFCRNVLMYFAHERAASIARGLGRALLENGWIAVSSSELCLHLFPDMTCVNFPGTMLYCRGTPGPTIEKLGSGSDPMPQTGDTQPIVKPHLPVAAARELPPAISFSCEPVTASTPLKSKKLQSGVAAKAGPGPDAALESQRVAGRDQRTTATSVRELANRGLLSEALASCDGAILADKLDPGLHYLRATILQELGRDGDAAEALKRALYADPNHVLAHFAMGNLALRQGKARTAKRHFDNVLTLLGECPPDGIVPESDGLTVGRFREIVTATLQAGALA